MEKKKLIRIKAYENSSCSNEYKYSNMHFAFVSNPTNKRVQCTSLISCRESVNIAPCSYWTYKKDSVLKSRPLIDFQKLRLLIVKDVESDNYNDFKTKLFSGKVLLNHYEKEAGWPFSKITSVKHPHYKNVWLLTGPKEWMSQPQLLSIATLFIRLMSIHGPLDMDASFQQAEDSLKTLYNEYMIGKKGDLNFTYYPDIEFYLKHLNDINLLINNTKKIFNGVGLSEAWAIDKSATHFSTYSGILSFFGEKPLTYNKNISNIQNNFAKLKNATLT